MASERASERARTHDDVEVAERGRAGVERGVAEDEAVAVVVHVAEADAVLAVAEDAQQPLPRGLEHVGQEEVVPRAVHLVG